MFGLTTTRRLRITEAQRDENGRLLTEAYGQIITDTARAARERWVARNRLARTLRAVTRLRADAARANRTARILAEQLLDATSGQNTAARTVLGLKTDPWQHATDGLNALVDAGIPFHIEPDGHISNPSGNEHIEYDRAAQRWRLVHDTDG
ncbi:hypothetical protein [Streptomyces sp. NPDC058280]|uniref:hypothetical protein n=1 Tax=Streptomyces sp. NPDC058280 TaxID=3346419 RepID=UPI0036EB8CD9